MIQNNRDFGPLRRGQIISTIVGVFFATFADRHAIMSAVDSEHDAISQIIVQMQLARQIGCQELASSTGRFRFHFPIQILFDRLCGVVKGHLLASARIVSSGVRVTRNANGVGFHRAVPPCRSPIAWTTDSIECSPYVSL